MHGLNDMLIVKLFTVTIYVDQTHDGPRDVNDHRPISVNTYYTFNDNYYYHYYYYYYYGAYSLKSIKCSFDLLVITKHVIYI